MNTLIRVRGYVLGSDVHEPTASSQTDKPKYELLVHPELPDDWFPIQEIIDTGLIHIYIFFLMDAAITMLIDTSDECSTFW